LTALDGEKAKRHPRSSFAARESAYGPSRRPRPRAAAAGLKYKAALSVAYGAGLRACEVVSLKVSDIDSKRWLIRVELGKGRKDRHVMLSRQLLEGSYYPWPLGGFLEPWRSA
jgi:integrase